MRCPASTLLPCLVSLAAVAAAQAPTRLEGLVLDPLSQPVANARLTAELDGEVIAETRSDASGTFVFAKLAWRGVQLRATTDAPDVGVTQLEPAYAPRGVVIVRTMPARRVHGLVRDIAGRPVAGAWVSCTPVSCLALAAAASATLTDENGRYALTHVPYDRVALRVWAADRAGIARELDGATDLEMNLDFSAEAPSVRGFLVRKGTAEQRAAVRCEIAAKTKPPISLLMPEVLRHPAIDADGAYFVRGWPRCDAIQATLRADEFALEPGWLRVDADLPDSVKSCDVDPEGAQIVHGRLSSSEGLAVGDVHLSAFVGQRCQSFTTAADGTFAFLSPGSPRTIFVVCCENAALVVGGDLADEEPGFAWTAYGARCLPPGKASVRLDLRAGRSVRARLVDEQGTPVAGAEVRLLDTKRDEVNGGGARGPAMTYQSSGEYVMTRSARDGTVAFPMLNLDAKTPVVLQAVGQGSFLRLEFQLEDRVTDLGTLRMGPAATLQGSVEFAGGGARGGAPVQIENCVDSQRNMYLACDRAGMFLVRDLIPGPCRTGIVGVQESRQIEMLAAAQTHRLDFAHGSK